MTNLKFVISNIYISVRYDLLSSSRVDIILKVLLPLRPFILKQITVNSGDKVILFAYKTFMSGYWQA